MLIGSARIDETGHISGGKAGDQTKQEVSTQEYYMHKKGWILLRPNKASIANLIAKAMLEACLNSNIGYDQGQRESIVPLFKKHMSLAKINKPCEGDCSKLIQLCVYQATGKDPGNFTTANAVNVLGKTGHFESPKEVKNNTVLYDGDILCTKTKGHIVAVVSGRSRTSPHNNENPIDKVAKEVIDGKWGTGLNRKEAIVKAGYDYEKVQKRVNEMLK